ncbi:SDR family oxidoreductase [Microlunatus lacustris]
MAPALPTVAVTGATGAVGGLVARALGAGGTPLRLLARTPERAPSLPGCVVLPSSYGDGEPSVSALRGVRTLFMVSAAEHEDRLAQHRAFVAAAAEAGVQHVVYTSFAAAAQDAVFTLGRDHWATEQAIVDAGLAHTFLRDSFYLDFLPETVGEDGVIRGPAGDGRVAAVSRADVARAAAAVLREPEPHRGATYELTGPEALSFADVAAQVSAAQGRPVAYVDETLEEAYASRAHYGAPRWEVDAWVSTYTAIATGQLARVTDDVQRLTGRPPLTLRQLLAEG